MANEEHLRILQWGVDAWNQWRHEHQKIQPDLSHADLRQMDIRHANLEDMNLIEANLQEVDLTGAILSHTRLMKAKLGGANLRGTSLRGADLSMASLRDAVLIGANLRGAHLHQADCHGANLWEANLWDADLREANLWGTNLTKADLSKAKFAGTSLWGTVFTSVDLRHVQGLENVKHFGPSTIDIQTIYESQGKIPIKFLQGAGVPENFIEYMHSLVGRTFEFYSCFISYSGRDQEFADRVYEGLQNNGVRCWFAPHHVETGKKLHQQIDTAIRLHERLLLILSPNSIKSEWVKTEIAKARKREVREDQQVLFPISLNVPYHELQEWECFDADTGKDSAREIREYYIPDFTKWKDHDSFKEEFKKLLRDLKKPDAQDAARAKTSSAEQGNN